MDQVKEAFQKVKEDITFLKQEILNIHKELDEIQNSILTLLSIKNNLHNQLDNTSNTIKNHQFLNPAIQQINTTNQYIPTNTSTDKYYFKALKKHNNQYSTGNRGVSTDRQTDQQTDTSTHFSDTSILLSQLDTLKKE